jgi:hypothetical protein
VRSELVSEDLAIEEADDGTSAVAAMRAATALGEPFHLVLMDFVMVRERRGRGSERSR